MRRKDTDQESGVAGTPASTASAMMTPLDIQQKEFQVSRLGGYRMRDVDEFLDQLTDALTAILAENERLRSGKGGAPLVGSPDLDEVSRQADEIIQRARDEAGRIIAEANERSASIAGGLAASSVTAVDREAIDAFLGRERAFLQSLASLVQEHADGVKGMAREVRRRTPTPERSSTSSPALAGSMDASATPREAPTPREAEPTRPIPAATDEPIVVSDPEPARAARREEDGDEGLRELFWGEEG